MQSVPITTKVVISNPTHGKVYSIQHYVIKFMSDLQQVDSFLCVLLFPSQIKLNWNIVDSGIKNHSPNHYQITYQLI
jgi:hypothetical protein